LSSNQIAFPVATELGASCFVWCEGELLKGERKRHDSICTYTPTLSCCKQIIILYFAFFLCPCTKLFSSSLVYSSIFFSLSSFILLFCFHWRNACIKQLYWSLWSLDPIWKDLASSGVLGSGQNLDRPARILISSTLIIFYVNRILRGIRQWEKKG
jgi:hypothetical protein